MNTNLCKANKIRYEFKDSNSILKLGLKTNQCFLTLIQIALSKIFNVDSTIPLLKLNGSRPKIAQGVFCSYIKDQVFIQTLNMNNTFIEQYNENYKHIKENFYYFTECDYTNALEIVSESLKKNVSPKICFNFYTFNNKNKYVIGNTLLTNEYDVVNSNMNIYFDVNLNMMTNVYSMTIFYKKKIFNNEVIQDLLNFVILGYKHIALIHNVKIKELSLDYLKKLEDKENIPINAKF